MSYKFLLTSRACTARHFSSSGKTSSVPSLTVQLACFMYILHFHKRQDENGRNALFVCGFRSPSSHSQINSTYEQDKYCGKLDSVGREAKTANIHTQKVAAYCTVWENILWTRTLFCRNVYPFPYLHEICVATYPHANSAYEQIQQVKSYKQSNAM